MFSGAVAAATPQARQTGEDILKAGGNAFDAAVAAALVLAVTEPGNSGPGGEGYCIFYDARAAQSGALCFMSFPGVKAVPENLLGKDLLRGPISPIVPGAVAGWCALIDQKCSLPAAKLLAPAIHFAEEGFALNDHLSGALNWHRDMFHPSAREIFARADRPWQPGDILRQPDLARTLRQIANGGSHAFYHGEFADRLDKFFCETGGLLCKADLAKYEPLWQKTLSRSFSDMVVHVPPPESTGFAVLYGLELLSRLGYASMPPAGLDAVRAIVAVLHEMDRRTEDIAARLTPYQPEVEYSIAELFEEGVLDNTTRHLKLSKRGTHTTSLSACDGQGNLVCISQTLDHGFGSGVVIPHTGVLMNNGMAWVNCDPTSDRADLVAPYKRTFLPAIPTIALSTSGQPLLAIGTPGGNGIPQTTLQVYANLLFHHDDLQSAIEKPRLVIGSIVPEAGPGKKVHLESGFSSEAHKAFPADKNDTGFYSFGRFHAVQLVPGAPALAVNDHRIY